jgi:alkaline phosphatase
LKYVGLLGGAGLMPSAGGRTWAGAQSNGDQKPLRFGLFADPHFRSYVDDQPRCYAPRNTRKLLAFVERMRTFQPDFVLNLGDWVVPRSREHGNTHAQYEGFKEDLGIYTPILKALPCPAYIVPGNHDVGWIRGGEENVTTADLIAAGHAGGHALCKDEWCALTGMPGRYYAFDAGPMRCVVLDGNNSQDSEVANDKDGVRGAYWIDKPQLAWLDRELKRHPERPKLVFCHEELHHTPHATGSGEGGWRPLPPHYKDGSYVGNGWQVRELLEQDGNVAAVFHGHYHKNRWAVYGGIHYITMENYIDDGTNWAEVTVHPKQLTMRGHDKQASFDLPIPATQTMTAPPGDLYETALQRRRDYQNEQ